MLVGAFQVSPWLAALATTGIIFAAVYLLWMYQRVIFGEVTHEENRRLTDLSLREWAVLLPLLVLIVWIGVYPSAFTGKTEATISALIAQVQSKASVALLRMTPEIVVPGRRHSGACCPRSSCWAPPVWCCCSTWRRRATPRRTWAASRWPASWPRCWWR